MQTKKKLIMTALAAAFVLGGCATTATAPKKADVKWPNLIVHLHGGNGKAYLVDPATDSVVATLDTEKSAGLGDTTPDGRKVYVGAEGEGKDTVTVIDLDKRSRGQDQDRQPAEASGGQSERQAGDGQSLGAG